MSNFEPLSTQPEWREQYSTFTLPGDNGLFPPPFEQLEASNVSESKYGQRQSRDGPPLEHRHSLGPSKQESQPVPTVERPNSAPGECGNQANNKTAGDGSLVSTESVGMSLGSNPLGPVASAPIQQGTITSNGEESINVEFKEEEEEDEDDDDMLDVEDGSAPQTAAERQAERRKMKRFRYDNIFAPVVPNLAQLIVTTGLPINKRGS
jgi:hypothetical protein